MPIYEYRCNACGHKLESLQRLSDAPLVTCPACGKDALAKQLSAAGFQLKGSGWYATDFKNSGSKPPAKDAAKDAAKPDAKGDAPAGAAGDAKPETSTATKADAPAAAPASKSADQGKSETRSTSDKPAATGTTSGDS
jgi:putative FmdB family regulatory protein